MIAGDGRWQAKRVHEHEPWKTRMSTNNGLQNSHLTQILEDNNSSASNATHVTTSLTPSEDDDLSQVKNNDKEEDVNDEPEARLGRLSETGM